jgi:hypothetical protein
LGRLDAAMVSRMTAVLAKLGEVDVRVSEAGADQGEALI